MKLCLCMAALVLSIKMSFKMIQSYLHSTNGLAIQQTTGNTGLQPHSFPSYQALTYFQFEFRWLTCFFKAFDQGKLSKLPVGKKKSTLRQ